MWSSRTPPANGPSPRLRGSPALSRRRRWPHGGISSRAASTARAKLAKLRARLQPPGHWKRLEGGTEFFDVFLIWGCPRKYGQTMLNPWKWMMVPWGTPWYTGCQIGKSHLMDVCPIQIWKKHHVSNVQNPYHSIESWFVHRDSPFLDN